MNFTYKKPLFICFFLLIFVLTPKIKADIDTVSLFNTCLDDQEGPFVFGSFFVGQLGNQMFQIATISAHAWDHNSTPCFPTLLTNNADGIPTNHKHVFFRCRTNAPHSPSSFFWTQPQKFHFSHVQIPYHPNMKIVGLFQNENYFAHHRDKILELFSPREDDLAYISERYKNILDHPKTVGVQVRNFGIIKDKDAWVWAAQYGYDYFQQAMSLFPDDTLFVVSTNDLEFARENIPTENLNVLFIENEQYYNELFLLSLCKHNIISNSTFGWWAAWLNQNPSKVVITPKLWINPDPKFLKGSMEVWPEEWIQIDAKWDKPHKDPSCYR